jgi:hypothetical protein
MKISNRCKALVLSAAMVLGASAVHAEHADEYTAGFMAAHEGDYSKAAQSWDELAKQGDARAQFNLALMYHGGVSVPYDEEKAVSLYLQAAENGHPRAQQYMAVGYQEGWFGLKQDFMRANYFYKKLKKNPYY